MSSGEQLLDESRLADAFSALDDHDPWTARPRQPELDLELLQLVVPPHKVVHSLPPPRRPLRISASAQPSRGPGAGNLGAGRKDDTPTRSPPVVSPRPARPGGPGGKGPPVRSLPGA